MKKLKSGLFQRGFSLAKLTAQSGLLAANSTWSSKDREDYLVKQMKLLSEELGQLKGSVMKVGQTLSMYGEHFLPPKANAYLKSLQFESPSLDWESLQDVIHTELGKTKLEQLEIEPTALAAASLGQVHKAIIKETGETIALKIQYPGIEKAIKSDLRTMKTILNLAQILPKGPKTNQFFEEIETMLIQETNYNLEKLWTEQTYKNLKDDSRYVVPKVFSQFCSKHILATSYEPGVKVDSPEVEELNQKRKNQIAYNFLELYFKELFEFKIVQTDPHLGNYKIRIDKDGNDQIVLYDFGAMREVPDHFGEPFRSLVQGSAIQDKNLILKSAYELGYIESNDDEELKERYVNMCRLIGEPFSEDPTQKFTDKDGNYDWDKTDLPKRVSKAATEIFKNHKLRVPPRESVFLDRKLGGAFIFVSVLGLNGKVMPLLKKYF